MSSGFGRGVVVVGFGSSRRFLKFFLYGIMWVVWVINGGSFYGGKNNLTGCFVGFIEILIFLG